MEKKKIGTFLVNKSLIPRESETFYGKKVKKILELFPLDNQ